jgi:hypothetical protein
MTGNIISLHVECGDEEAVISIPDGNVIEGSIRTAKLRLVQAWIEIHQGDLMADWRLVHQRSTGV